MVLACFLYGLACVLYGLACFLYGFGLFCLWFWLVFSMVLARPHPDCKTILNGLDDTGLQGDLQKGLGFKKIPRGG